MAPKHLRSLTVLLVLGCLSCTKRVVDSRAFSADGELTWSTVMPSSRNTALWLRYSLEAPLVRGSTEEEGFLHYELNGQLRLKVDGRVHYGGGVYLKPEGIVLDRVYSKGERDEVLRNCGYSSCTESGRLKLLTMHEVPAGARLEFVGSMPLQYGEAILHSAQLELGPN